MCDCIKIEYALAGAPTTTTIQVNSIGTYNGSNLYSWSIGANTYFMYHDGGTPGNWIVTLNGYPFPSFSAVAEYKTYAGPCPPFASIPGWVNTVHWDTFITSACDVVPEVGPCECGITITLSADGLPAETVTALVTGLYNNRLEFSFVYNNTTYYIQWNATAGQWEIEDRKAGIIIGVLPLDILCPLGTLDDWTGYFTYEFFTSTADCLECGLEDRHKKEYNVITLPEGYTEEKRGFNECCCEYMVLASEENDTFKNDVTSAWVQVNDETDTQEFKLYKEGVEITTLPSFDFPNDSAKYTTVYWSSILFTYGPGCYELKIEYSIGGIAGSVTWGIYKLQPYTIENALKTARVRSIFNGYQQTQGLDFTGANIEDSLRFYGYIGNRQTNTELDNLIYNNREMRRVIRENLNTYEIITDPSLECIIKPLIDLHLLSENELFISDYNAHNHSYRYRDIPVIVQSSPKLDYYDLSRKATLTCEVADKFKTNRTFYK